MFDACPDKFYFPGKSSKSIFKIDKRISLTFIVSWTSILLKWSNHIMCKISISSYLRKAVCQTLREDVIYKSNKTNNKFPPKSPDYEETILVVFRKIFESLNKWQAGIPVMMSKETDTSRLSAFTKGIFSCKPDKKILDTPKNKTTRREKVFLQ